jgi:hypothetical protein
VVAPICEVDNQSIDEEENIEVEDEALEPQKLILTPFAVV